MNQKKRNRSNESQGQNNKYIGGSNKRPVSENYESTDNVKYSRCGENHVVSDYHWNIGVYLDCDKKDHKIADCP